MTYLDTEGLPELKLVRRLRSELIRIMEEAIVVSAWPKGRKSGDTHSSMMNFAAWPGVGLLGRFSIHDGRCPPDTAAACRGERGSSIRSELTFRGEVAGVSWAGGTWAESGVKRCCLEGCMLLRASDDRALTAVEVDLVLAAVRALGALSLKVS
jgi:hypothetical protein